MSDTQSGEVETKTAFKLSKKDINKLAVKAAELNAQIAASEAEAKAAAEGKVVDPSTRPGFDASAPIEDDATKLPLAKGILPGGLDLDDKKSFSINYFPRDFDPSEYSVARASMAAERERNTTEGTTAWKHYAPKEAAYIDALKVYEAKSTKAVGEMVSGTDGGFLAPEVWSQQFYDMLYPKQILSSLPITRLPVSSRVVHIPKLTSQVAIAYSAESAALSATSPAFSQVSLTMRKQYAFVQIPNELIRDSAPAADQIIYSHATTRMAVDRDTQILRGNGQAGAPFGLLNSTNVTATNLGANGATPKYTDLATGIYNVRNLNGSTNVPVGQTDCTGVVGAVRLETTVANMTDSQNRPLWAYGLNQIGRVPAPGFLGVPNWVLSNIIPTNLTVGSGTTCSEIYYGDWQYLLYAMRQDVEFLATNVGGTSFQNDQTWVRLISRYDVAVVHPEAFFIQTAVLQ